MRRVWANMVDWVLDLVGLNMTPWGTWDFLVLFSVIVPVAVVMGVIGVYGAYGAWGVAGTPALAATNPPVPMMLEGSIRLVSPGSFELMVPEGPYCPGGVMCPLFLTRPVTYQVADSGASVFTPSGRPLSISALQAGAKVVVSGDETGTDQVAASGVLILQGGTLVCRWPDPYGPPCVMPLPCAQSRIEPVCPLGLH